MRNKRSFLNYIKKESLRYMEHNISRVEWYDYSYLKVYSWGEMSVAKIPNTFNYLFLEKVTLKNIFEKYGGEYIMIFNTYTIYIPKDELELEMLLA